MSKREGPMRESFETGEEGVSLLSKVTLVTSTDGNVEGKHNWAHPSSPLELQWRFSFDRRSEGRFIMEGYGLKSLAELKRQVDEAYEKATKLVAAMEGK